MASGNGVKQEENGKPDPNKGSPTQKANGEKTEKSPAKKRRKVNHACIYCRRSHMTCDLERPCTRCIKRNIGHLCHDEPREPAKKGKAEVVTAATTESSDVAKDTPDRSTLAPTLSLGPLPPHRITSTAPLVQPTPVPAGHRTPLNGPAPGLLGFQGHDWQFGNQSHLMQDMHNLHPSYMFNSSEVSDEYNLLNNFLNHSLLEEGGVYGNEDNGMFGNNMMSEGGHNGNSANGGSSSNAFQQTSNFTRAQPVSMQPPSQAAVGNAISRPASGFPMDKARETFYFTAADPAGVEAPEERLKKLLKAKYDAGMLKPFNYVKGYARLNAYMERTLSPISRMKILRHIDKFRPKFRERIRDLSDMQLTYVEMQFERSLLEYDRIFASMAIPACCWRRTGEIFRGNKEMAELIHVPIENLKDGRVAIHEIFAENSLVSYWEKFGAIAFDSSQKAILTTCAIKALDKENKEPEIRCCFSFTIRRDTHNIPSLIVGNFLPIMPKSST